MKAITLTTFKLEEAEIKEKDLAKACVNQVGERGLSADDIRKRLRILDAIDKDTTEVSLEDADAEELKKLVAAMQWRVVHPGVVAFCDKVAAL